MSPAEPGRAPRIPVGQAVALGLVHGPAELLPISSSAHVGAVPWLFQWSYRELDETQRKSFEVALHAGTAAALLLRRRGELGRQVLRPPTLALIAAASLPPAVTGYALEVAIEKRFGTPATVAIALVAGSLAMALADRAPQSRSIEQAGTVDALWLGAAQAVALIPGVSRHGAALSAARLRRFRRSDAYRLSDLVGLAPIIGASALRLSRQHGRLDAALVAGAGASFASTLAAERLVGSWERDRPLWPFAVYRLALAGAIAARLRRGSTARPDRPAQA